MVKHHVSYRKNIVVNLTPHQHFLRHFGWGKCCLCKRRGGHKRYFAPVNPFNGLGHSDIIRNPRTGNLNHPWPRRGKWVLVCDECKVQAIGIRIASEGYR